MQGTINQLLARGKELLAAAGIANGRLEAAVLLRNLLGWEQHQLILAADEKADDLIAKRYLELIGCRQQGYPLQYLTREQDFMGLKLKVTPSVLIPRWDTEVLVEAVLKSKLPDRLLAVDVGTGSGAIAVALAMHRPSWRILATDISPAALAVAQENSDAHGAQLTLLCGDLLEPLARLKERPMLIVSNPPYIAADQMATLMQEVKHEPRLALDGGHRGLAVYQRLLPQAYAGLAAGGLLALEIGADQKEAVRQICKAQGFVKIEAIKDYQGLFRVILARK